jgi:transposase
MTKEEFARIDAFIEHNCEFLTCDQIAEELGVGYAQIYSRLRKLGMQCISPAAQNRQMVKEWATRKTRKELIQWLNLSEDQIRRIAQELGIELLEERPKQKNTSLSDSLATVSQDLSYYGRGPASIRVAPWQTRAFKTFNAATDDDKPAAH